MSKAILAVDFGTSTSSAALVANGETIPIREASSGSWSWPSAVYRDGDALLVGTLAERRKQVRPAMYRAEFKRDFGQDVPVILGDQGFPVEALVTELISALREEAERVHGAPIDRAMLTIPASYGPADPRRDLMIGAAEAAGFTVVELIPEPVAAALAPPAWRTVLRRRLGACVRLRRRHVRRGARPDGRLPVRARRARASQR